jgi:hypothetical protein
LRVDLTTTRGSSQTRDENSPTACRKTQSLWRATRSLIQDVNICAEWATGVKTRMLSFSLMVLAASTSSSRQTCIDQASTFHLTLLRTRRRPKALPKWPNEPATKSLVFPTTSFGTTIHKKRAETYEDSRLEAWFLSWSVTKSLSLSCLFGTISTIYADP